MIALSCVEVEFRGIVKGIAEALVIELGFSEKGSCEIYCDNKAAISILGNLFNMIERSMLKLINKSLRTILMHYEPFVCPVQRPTN